MRWTTVLISAIFATLAGAQEQNADSSDVLENIVIEESYEAAFEEEKPTVRLKLDFSDLVHMNEELNWTSIDAITNPTASDHADWLDLRISAPELATIRPAPVKTFHTRFKKISRWQLDITTSDGSLFRAISGKGSPPAQIHWDGKGDNGEPLLAGYNYAYTFTAVDKAGNKRTFPGETFSVPAFYLLEDDKLFIGVADSELFANDLPGLKPQTGQYAQEIASLIRYFSEGGNVTVQSKNKMLDDFLALLAEDLVCESGFFDRRPAPTSAPNGLRIYVE